MGNKPTKSSVRRSTTSSVRRSNTASGSVSASASASASDGQQFDYANFGCKHYRRKCMIRAPCCDQVFQCRLCHDEAMNSLEVDPTRRHDIPRHQVKRVICSVCNTEQNVKQMCKRCGVCMGNYFCAKCKFFDDDVSKEQFHCDKCGICRTGGGDNYFHCDKCGCCYSKTVQYTHICVERAIHDACPICYEILFDSRKDTTTLRCGHRIHLECVREMERHSQYLCPICSKSTCDMSEVWKQIDEEVASTPLPEEYWHKNVWILCNDCGEQSQVFYHIVGLKCYRCNSYNTRQI